MQTGNPFGNREEDVRDEWHETPAQRMVRVLRMMASIFGIAVMAVGLFYATRLFTVIYETLQDPVGQAPLFDHWAQLIAGEEGFDITVQGQTLHLARLLGIVVVGGGLLVLTWIAMGMMLVGARIVSTCLGDLDAVRRILNHAFGPLYQRQQPRTTAPPTPPTVKP